MNTIPEIINDFNIYQDGNKLIGVSGEVSLPSFEAVTETISGAGILGEYEARNPGQFSAQDFEVPFRIMYGDIFKLMKGTVSLTLRGSVQISDGSGQKKAVGMRVIVIGNAKTLNGGTVSAGKPMSASATLALTYIKIEIDGNTAVELDKLNGIYVVDGTDQLSDVRSLC